MTEVAVVVCCHRLERTPMLLAALESLAAQVRTPDEVIVVVDGTPELRDRIREARGPVGPCERWTETGRNQGVSIARNLGAETASATVVAFLDDDAIADPRWLEVLIDALAADPRALGAGGASLAEFEAPRPAWLPEEFLWTMGCSYRGLPTESSVVRNLFGGCGAVYRRQFLDLGGYADDTGHRGDFVGGGEEADFCLRATAATGQHFRYEPAAVIRHRVPAERLTLGYYRSRCYAEGRAKARLGARRTHGLDAERSFARRLPRAALDHLRTRGEGGQVIGLVVGAAAVVAGLLRERIALSRNTQSRNTRHRKAGHR